MTNLKLILASKSHARITMLQNAGLDFEAIPADLDESGIIKAQQNVAPESLAQTLAKAKAIHVAQLNPNAITIGSDQILVYNGQIFEKASNKNAAREKLKTLRGKTHQLISSVAVAKGSNVLWQTNDRADLTMRDFDDAFLARYIKAAGDDLTNCVGGYALEKSGITLFSDIKGNYHTILGMPLLPLLAYLQDDQGMELL